MQGVGPGSLLAGRYSLRDRLTQHARWERWSATDAHLGLDVVLLCFPSAAPEAEAVLDAARRAAAVEDSRLTRLLDVGQDAAVCFVVEEATPDATPFTSLVEDGGLPASEVRRIVAEVAQGLATACARGLHHGVLTPREVLVRRDGSVTVRGLATQAALLGEEDRPADQASRADAVALAGLLYAGLTGRWPLPGPDSGLDTAPRVPSGVVAPSQIVAAVPADIDALVTRTLHGDDGPGAPDDVADALFPGSARHRGPTRPPPSPRPPSARPRSPRAPAASGRRTARGDGRTAGRGKAPVTGSGRRENRVSATAGEEATRGTPMPTDGDRGTSSSATGVEQATGQAEGGIDASPELPPRPAAAAGAVAVTAAATAAATAKTAAERVRGGLGRLGATASTVAGQVGTATRTAVSRVVERPDTKTSAEPASVEHDDARDARLTDVLEETDERLEPAVPRAFVPDAVPDREQSRLALGIVAGFVVLAALLGIWGLPSLGGTPSAAPNRTTIATPATPSESSTPTSGSTPTSPPPSLREPAPIPIVRTTGFEPTNGGEVASGTARRAYDGDPETDWQSKWFATETFGGLPIEGIGLIADLGQATDVRRVDLQLPVKQDGTVYVADEASLDEAKPLGTFTDQEGTVVLDSPSGTPLNGQLVIVYVTRLGPDDDGRFRARVSELRVSG